MFQEMFYKYGALNFIVSLLRFAKEEVTKYALKLIAIMVRENKKFRENFLIKKGGMEITKKYLIFGNFEDVFEIALLSKF